MLPTLYRSEDFVHRVEGHLCGDWPDLVGFLGLVFGEALRQSHYDATSTVLVLFSFKKG